MKEEEQYFNLQVPLGVSIDSFNKSFEPLLCAQDQGYSAEQNSHDLCPHVSNREIDMQLIFHTEEDTTKNCDLNCERKL